MRENGKDGNGYGKDYRSEILMDAIGEVDDSLLAEADAWRSEQMERAEAEGAVFDRTRGADNRRAQEAGRRGTQSAGRRGRQKSPWNRYAVPALMLAACFALVFVAQKVGILRPMFHGAGSASPSDQAASAPAPAWEEAKSEEYEEAAEEMEEAAPAEAEAMTGMADAGAAKNAAEAETAMAEEAFDMAEAEYAAEEAEYEAAEEPAAEMPMMAAGQDSASESAAEEKETAAKAEAVEAADEGEETAVVSIDAMDVNYRRVELTEKEQKDLKAIMGDRIAENESGIWYMTVVMQGKTKLQTAEQLILKGADGQLTLWEIAD